MYSKMEFELGTLFAAASKEQTENQSFRCGWMAYASKLYIIPCHCRIVNSNDINQEHDRVAREQTWLC